MNCTEKITRLSSKSFSFKTDKYDYLFYLEQVVCKVCLESGDIWMKPTIKVYPNIKIAVKNFLKENNYE